MSISTCPQPSGRLLALWLFAKHQQAFKEVTVDIMSNVSAFLEAMAAPPMTGRPDRAAAAKPRNRAENARASGRASGVRDSAGPGPTRRLRNPTGPLPNARASPPTALGGGTSYCCRCSTVWGPAPYIIDRDFAPGGLLGGRPGVPCLVLDFDPNAEAMVVWCAAPPCQDFSRVAQGGGGPSG